MSEKNKLTVTVVEGKHEAILVREFDAPRELVFKAMCDGDAMIKMWGKGSEIQEFDARPGGSWSISSPMGEHKYISRGVYHDVVAPERIVRTSEYMPGKVILDTTILEDIGGRTKMTAQQLYQSVQDRDTVVQYGLEKGANGGLDKLEEVLETYK